MESDLQLRRLTLSHMALTKGISPSKHLSNKFVLMMVTSDPESTKNLHFLPFICMGTNIPDSFRLVLCRTTSFVLIRAFLPSPFLHYCLLYSRAKNSQYLNRLYFQQLFPYQLDLHLMKWVSPLHLLISDP